MKLSSLGDFSQIWKSDRYWERCRVHSLHGFVENLPYLLSNLGNLLVFGAFLEGFILFTLLSKSQGKCVFFKIDHTPYLKN